ncbi:ABC transporter ATP-binding protein [Desnuesiella massiliensis]|uniref:ABC transporter ATP-binding protein n=1 Tax=Desnuesiella massiliensis TaxID=1650662 RepID=UPI0006E3BBAE|nr:ABC transporter ATP-binding protein [Desnuesiella massiliensis]
MKENNKKSCLKELKELRPFLINEKKWIVLNCIASFFEGIIMLYLSYATKNLIDRAYNKQIEEFKFSLVITALVVLINIVVVYISRYSSLRYKTDFMCNLRGRAVGHMIDMPLVAKEKYTSGDIISRINNDIKIVSELIVGIFSIVLKPVIFLGAFIYMFSISWKLLLASVIFIPFSAYLFNKASKPIEVNSKKIMEDNGKINSLIKDSINGVYILKAFNLKDILFLKYSNTLDEIVKRGINIEKINASLIRLFISLRYIPQLIVPLFGGYLAIKGGITLGELLASTTLIWYVFKPVEAFLDLNKQIRETMPSVRRVLEFIKEPKENKVAAKVSTAKEQEVVARFSKVSFGYNEGDKVIKDLSFELEKGKITALVGQSGCGKSTVLKILCDFYDSYEGKIEVLGKDLRKAAPWDVRKNLAYVSQNIYLFPTTIAENIGYGKINAAMEEIIEAAEMANAHEFIMALPNKYNTVIGDGEIKLSGGEQQRISLARAILKDAPILLLDEATSALDMESESLVQKSLERFMKNRTALVVAHRMSTIKNANKVLVMKDGTIIEVGSHEELMKRDSFYKSLYLKQFHCDNNAS